MMRTVIFLLALCFCGTVVLAQDKSQYEKHWFVKDGDTLPYRLLLPENYDAKKKYPLVLFLHGAGERGSDNEKQLVHGASVFLRDSVRKNYPAIVVFPQCGADSYWSNVQFRFDSAGKRTFVYPSGAAPTKAMSLLIELIDELGDEFRLDKKQMYVGGLSMGGMGTFELVSRKPKKFAAAFPICGGGNDSLAGKMTKPAWWIFHGMKDNVVPPSLSEEMAAAIKAKGGRVKLTLYPNANHNSWDPAFAEPELLKWLFGQRK